MTTLRALNPPDDKEAGEIRVSLMGLADLSPIFDSALRVGDGRALRGGRRSGNCCNLFDTAPPEDPRMLGRWTGEWGRSARERKRRRVSGASCLEQGFGKRSHVRMVKSAGNRLAKWIAVTARNQGARGIVHKSVKKSVIGRRYGPAQACLSWAARFLGGEVAGLFEEVGMQAHLRSSISPTVLKLT